MRSLLGSLFLVFFATTTLRAMPAETIDFPDETTELTLCSKATENKVTKLSREYGGGYARLFFMFMVSGYAQPFVFSSTEQDRQKLWGLLNAFRANQSPPLEGIKITAELNAFKTTYNFWPYSDGLFNEKEIEVENAKRVLGLTNWSSSDLIYDIVKIEPTRCPK